MKTFFRFMLVIAMFTGCLALAIEQMEPAPCEAVGNCGEM